jgi:hypothetical protein
MEHLEVSRSGLDAVEKGKIFYVRREFKSVSSAQHPVARLPIL